MNYFSRGQSDGSLSCLKPYNGFPLSPPYPNPSACKVMPDQASYSLISTLDQSDSSKATEKNHTTTQFYKLLMLCLMTTFLTMHPNFLFYLKFSQYLVFPPISEHWPTLLAVPRCPSPHLPACSLNDTSFSKSLPHSTEPTFLGQGEHKGDTLILLSDALCYFLHFGV